MDAYSLLTCQGCCVSLISMAVPFVQDWDLVQTLGEGAYGEYDSSFNYCFTILDEIHSIGNVVFDIFIVTRFREDMYDLI